MAYYFHGEARCQSCLLIEKYSYSAITRNFDREIGEGTIDFRVINVEEPANSHFVKDYGLYTKSVVLSLVKNGKEQKWKNLKKVWEYLQDEGQFQSYIVSEVNAYKAELNR
ncbi:MAG: hypothetical protein HQK54_10165 [Oligoflexales bacterium]|nr:hypothetical protein [Oligoflexales bacterium]